MRRLAPSFAALVLGGVLLGAAAARGGSDLPARQPRVYVRPQLNVSYFALNLRRPLFRDNPRLARALNSAIDRQALIRTWGVNAGVATDRILPAHLPGRTRTAIYPLRRPDLARARALAAGHTRDGQAIIGVPRGAAPALQRRAAIVQHAFSELGIEARVDVVVYSPLRDFAADVFFSGANGNHSDPRQFFDRVLRDLFVRAGPIRMPLEPRWTARLQTADRLAGPMRMRAFDRLDRDLMGTAPPIVPYMTGNARVMVSGHVGCFTYQPVYGTDFAAACLR
jgi:Bacterial extracellular solute-binding proteins, family 5 Middle